LFYPSWRPHSFLDVWGPSGAARDGRPGAFRRLDESRSINHRFFAQTSAIRRLFSSGSSPPEGLDPQSGGFKGGGVELIARVENPARAHPRPQRGGFDPREFPVMRQ